ncbi:unnamed protein product [Cercopithifilaria johnstoni]|uniref:RNase H type-1 domain-containing protein n=1 Tax=Cercopithifilaria johnstoni TaxID=2874296 RepID=A0A8J2LYH3_9BILA|nr:unnamed protein product [Cercopithifilaria johnstoni]
MRAISFSRFINWPRPLQFVISTYPVIGKRTFTVVCNNPQSTIHANVRNVRGRHDTSSSSEGRSLYSSEASNNWNNVPVVKAFAHVPNNSNYPIIAIYWDDSSKCNRFKKQPGRSITKAEIEVVCLALKQAVFQMNLPRVHIVTNSKFVWKHFGKISLWWSLDEFLQQKSMTFSSCSAEAQDLYRLLHMIDATIEYNSSTKETAKKFFENVVGKEGSRGVSDIIPEKKLASETFSSKTVLSKLQKSADKSLFVSETSSAADSKNYASKNLLGDSIPIVYTCGVLHIEGNEKKYVKAGYGVYWPHALELGTGKRYNFYPVTLVRCQLQAIIDALQQAVDQNYHSIVLRTDSVSFLVHHSRQWLKANGSYVRYHDQYVRIMDLCKDIKVRFQPASDRVALSQAEALAENGICLPTPSRRSQKKMYDNKTSSATDIKCSL